ncbi:DUF2891 domain-containing protein [Robertkochia solimangrovi]|uniref:DUF2891 domain-containing protein n=1 Tax=Robertkochia solimangrovi TaxID=2213046 RepID=UPI00117EFE5F|nr:DUF2891 domain-containing protein [Robertkochia solimangrovi]TRZ42560.1 DUF2891 domain-containing protein [Robertkochia solimangrovi]
MKKLLLNVIGLCVIFLVVQCKTKEISQESSPLKLTLSEANRLSKLPLECMQVEYPNRLGQTLHDSSQIGNPKLLHPAFYGCFDWHSSVHGHWSLVKLLKEFPELGDSERIRNQLKANLSKDNINAEIAYFDRPGSASYERTYGWAWLLKLAEEIHTWDDPLARELESNLQPLSELIATKFIDFLPKLLYPIRVGEHTNTAFGLTFAYDYAEAFKNDVLKDTIISRAKAYYRNDRSCPITWEPGGSDFLSPCLEEADIMRRVLNVEEFRQWIKDFLPQLSDKDFHLETGKVSDRTDGKLVHLDGVNFSRAWCLYGISKTLPEYRHLNRIAREHIAHSLPSIVDENYEGTHWLGSFAIYALNSAH